MKKEEKKMNQTEISDKALEQVNGGFDINELPEELRKTMQEARERELAGLVKDFEDTFVVPSVANTNMDFM